MLARRRPGQSGGLGQLGRGALAVLDQSEHGSAAAVGERLDAVLDGIGGHGRRPSAASSWSWGDASGPTSTAGPMIPAARPPSGMAGRNIAVQAATTRGRGWCPVRSRWRGPRCARARPSTCRRSPRGPTTRSRAARASGARVRRSRPSDRGTLRSRPRGRPQWSRSGIRGLGAERGRQVAGAAGEVVEQVLHRPVRARRRVAELLGPHPCSHLQRPGRRGSVHVDRGHARRSS